jgi:hypothetical protein
MKRSTVTGVLWISLLLVLIQTPPTAGQTSPSTYSAYTGTDAKVIPSAPALGPANSVITDPTFGSRILRVTDQNTDGGRSFMPSDTGFFRTWNADSTAIKLQTSGGVGYWLEFNPNTFRVGDGSANPVVHQLALDYRWMWSAVNPDLIYHLNGNQLARYNKSTGVSTNLGGPPNGDPVTYYAAVVGPDSWVCSAAGPGIQDTWTEIFCVDPNNSANAKFIDIPNRTINGVPQSDPNWPTPAAGKTIGIHGLYGNAAGPWLGVNFRQPSWGGNGDAVLNLTTNTWSLVTNADPYWSGHPSLGNGKFVNGSGSIDGRDTRGAVVRDPNDLMNSSKYVFIMQPPTTVNWQTGEHNSWFNSASNPSAPVLFSRYGPPSSPPLTWEGEIIAAAVDGSNTVWRFAHHHGATGPDFSFFQCAFAQISNDGRWALFSSYWDGSLGPSPGGDFFLSTRIDTFIVELASGSSAQNVVWTNVLNSTVNGNSLQRTSGCEGCAGGGLSQQQIVSGDGYVEFTASETNLLRYVGLGAPNASLANGFDIMYAVQLAGSFASVYESGAYRTDVPLASGDRFRVAIEAGSVKYYKNGQVFYPSAVQPIYPLVLNATLLQLGSTVTNAVIAGAQ